MYYEELMARWEPEMTQEEYLESLEGEDGAWTRAKMVFRANEINGHELKCLCDRCQGWVNRLFCAWYD